MILRDIMDDARAQRDMNVYHFAAEIGCTVAYVNAVERETTRASAKYVIGAIRALGLDRDTAVKLTSRLMADQGQKRLEISTLSTKARVAVFEAMQKTLVDEALGREG